VIFENLCKVVVEPASLRLTPSNPHLFKGARVSSAAPPLRVLLVDDDPAFAELIKTLLKLDGIELLDHALDGAEGVELALNLEPDVVLMDIRMPVMDGFEATRRIVGAIPDVRVLVVSSSRHLQDAERAREAGAVGYLPKDRVTADLREWLERFRPPSNSHEARIVATSSLRWRLQTAS
jgi:CheY-like chemotaxis protein